MYITSCLGLALTILSITQSLVWLGFSIDAPLMTSTLLQEKVVEVLSECAAWKSRAKASHRQLQSLAGKLNHLSKYIRPIGSHVFNSDLLLDLEWFPKFASTFNGIQLLPAAPRKMWVIECNSTLEGSGAFSEVAYYAINNKQPIGVVRLTPIDNSS